MSIVPHYRRTNVTERMENIAYSLIDSPDINDIIDKVTKVKGLDDRQRLWIIYKVSQIQAARNIIAIAENGLNIMGVGR